MLRRRAGPGETNMQRHTAHLLTAEAMSVVAHASWAQCPVEVWRPIFPAAIGPADGPVNIDTGSKRKPLCSSPRRDTVQGSTSDLGEAAARAGDLRPRRRGRQVCAFLAMWRPRLPCIGDLNGDPFINGVDLGLLLSAWGECADCAADLNDDDAVNGDDLGPMLAAW